MKNNRTIFLVLFLICFLIGIFLRLFRLEEFPPQLNRDEAALALNAKFIYLVGKDEWQTSWPLQFKSFGDYKLPGYIYLLSFLFHFGMNDFVVRLPAALAGIGMLVVTTIWCSQLLKVRKKSIIVLLFFAQIAISPFSIFYSRMAWEANVGLFLMMSALCLLFKSKLIWKTDLLACFVFVLATFTYNSPLLLLPFLILALVIHRGVKNFHKWKIAVFGLTLVFLFVFLLFFATTSQKSGITFFQDGLVLSRYPEYRESIPSILRPILGNKIIYFAQIAFDHFLETFSPQFLVMRGGSHPWHSILGRGHIYWVTYILFIIGFLSQVLKIFALFKDFITKKKDFNINKLREVVPLYLLLISPLPAIFTTDAPHATRSLFTFVMVIILSVIGLQTLSMSTKKFSRWMRPVVLGYVIVILTLEASWYCYQYFWKWGPIYSPDFMIGFSEYLKETAAKYPDQPIMVAGPMVYQYATLAWYMNIQPQEFFETIQRKQTDETNLFSVDRLSKYIFVPEKNVPPPANERIDIYWDADSHRWETRIWN